jgi:uncharacterized protein
MERFDWDDANTRHLAAHGVTQEEFEQAYRTAILGPRTRHHRERRYTGLGETDDGRVLAFIYVKRRRKIRAVTAYTAPRKLRTFYAEKKGQR